MKKNLILLVILLLFLTSCGETQEEKNQAKAIKGGLGILYEMGKQAQDGASDEEVMNTGLDKMANLVGTITDGTDQELTKKEKEDLKKGVELLKNGGKGLKEELKKELSKDEEKQKEYKAEEKKKYLRMYGKEEQPKWAVEVNIIKPEGLTFEYRHSLMGKDSNIDYIAYYSGTQKEMMDEAKRMLDKLGIKSTYQEKNMFTGEFVTGNGDNGDFSYYIKGGGTEGFVIRVNKINLNNK